MDFKGQNQDQADKNQDVSQKIVKDENRENGLDIRVKFHYSKHKMQAIGINWNAEKTHQPRGISYFGF